MSYYFPPENTKIPFNFTTQGYVPIDGASLLFKFASQGNLGTLTAAINVMQPYLYETHTYVKSCPKYVVGYGSGRVQIIKGRCLFGGIRDLQGSILGLPLVYTIGGLSAYINSILNFDQSDLLSSCFPIKPEDLSAFSGGHLPIDISSTINSIEKNDFKDLNTFIDLHSPGDINSYIGVHQPIILPASIVVLKNKGIYDLSSLIDLHNSVNISSIISAHSSVSLYSNIRSFKSEYKYLPSFLHAWEENNLTSNIETHNWASLYASVGTSSKGIYDLNSYILSEKNKSTGSILSQIDIHLYKNLSLNITAVRSEIADFGSILHSWELRDIQSSVDLHQPDKLISTVRGWASININFGSVIRPWYKNNFTDISSVIDIHLPNNLQSIIDLHISEKLESIIRSWNSVYKNLGTTIKSLSNYFSNITSVTDTHQPIDFQSFIDLHQPINLFSTIGVHTYNNFQIILRTWLLGNQQNLYSVIAGLQQGNLSAYLAIIPPGNLRVYLRAWQRSVPTDLTSNLHGWQESQYFNSIVDLHQPIDIQSIIRGLVREVQKNLVSNLYGWQDSIFEGIIGGHMWGSLSASTFLYLPPLLNTSIRGWVSNIQKDLNTIVHGWKSNDLNILIGGHQYGILNIILRSFCSDEVSTITGNVFGWKQGSLSAYLGGALPVDLKVYLRVWNGNIYNNLVVLAYGWQESPNLNSLVEIHQPKDIKFIIRGWETKVYKNLSSMLHGWKFNNLTTFISPHQYKFILSSIRVWMVNINNSLPSSARGWQDSNLNGSIGTHLWGSLPASIFLHPPPLLPVVIRGWYIKQHKDLYSNAHGWQTGNLKVIIGGNTYGTLNIILKSFHRAVIVDIPGNIHGWQQSPNLITHIGSHTASNFGIILKGMAIGVIKDLYSYIRGWQKLDLSISIKSHQPSIIIGYIRIFQVVNKSIKASIHGWQKLDMPAFGGGHLPLNIAASIRMWYTGKFKSFIGLIHGWQELDLNVVISAHPPIDLNSFLRATKKFNKLLYANVRGWQKLDLKLIIGAHNPVNLSSIIDTHAPINLIGAIKAFQKKSKLLSSIIHVWQTANIGIKLKGTHKPIDFLGQIFVEQRSIAILPSYIRAWHARNLTAYLNVVYIRTLQATLYPIPPVNLSGYLKVWYKKSLPSFIRGWQTNFLGASIKQIYVEHITARIYSKTDMYKNLRAMIEGSGDGYKNLRGLIVAFQWVQLGAILRATYLTNISAYLYAVAPKNLSAKIHVWHERFLQGLLNGQNYPWNLTAQIFVRGGWRTFTASIQPRKNMETSSDLSISIHPWEIRLFPAYIYGENAKLLSAYLNPLGYARDLHASIRPKVIRLTTIISIPTQVHKDLSATINYLCFRTGSSDLPSNVYTKYLKDLSAYIKPIKYVYKTKTLGAKVGYTDSYLEVDKLKISINIYPNEFFTENKYKIKLNLLDATISLTAYIRGTLRYNELSSNIVGKDVPRYTFDWQLKNREIVINKTYDGIFKEFETVEMAFKSAVNDYFFSSDGNTIWKSNSLDKWVLSLKSMLPANTELGTIRRLHRATTLYDLKSFKSVDEAIKASIAYVSEYPQSCLSATLNNVSENRFLSSIITPKYTKNEEAGLISIITSIGNTVIVNDRYGISKI
jgi:hypothetical protein